MPRSASVLGGGSVTLDPVAFEASFNMPLVHETVRAELNARRHGTASTKTRGQVSGGGAKPWRQKGTGRARAGSSRSPVWTGGGTVFGPSPRHYTVKVNRKARRAALRSVLSLHAQRESLAVFDAGAFDGPSTKQAVELLEAWGAASPTLVILTDEEAAAGKSFRNLSRVRAIPVQQAGVADVIGAASLLVSQAALESLVALAAKSAGADSVGDSAGASAKSAGADSVGDSAGAESPAKSPGASAKSAGADSVVESADADSTLSGEDGEEG